MKKFKKTKDELFICEECGKILGNTMNSLSFHLNHYHNMKNYFDKYLKERDEELCKICNNQTEFYNIHKGYKNCCCKSCANEFKKLKTTEAIILKYGVDNISKVEEIKKRKEKTCLKNYGVKAGFADVQKRTKTLKEKYGVDHNFKIPECIEKRKQTWMKTLGVDQPLKNKNVLEKGQKTAKTLKQYNDKIWYQGSYELDFLKKYYNKYPDIERGPSIKYGNSVYYPDFFIPSINLIIEIKSSWTLTVDEEIEEKKKATIANGFNYIMILNKNYNELEQYHFSNFTT